MERSGTLGTKPNSAKPWRGAGKPTHDTAAGHVRVTKKYRRLNRDTACKNARVRHGADGGPEARRGTAEPGATSLNTNWTSCSKGFEYRG